MIFKPFGKRLEMSRLQYYYEFKNLTIFQNKLSLKVTANCVRLYLVMDGDTARNRS